MYACIFTGYMFIGHCYVHSNRYHVHIEIVNRYVNLTLCMSVNTHRMRFVILVRDVSFVLLWLKAATCKSSRDTKCVIVLCSRGTCDYPGAVSDTIKLYYLRPTLFWWQPSQFLIWDQRTISGATGTPVFGFQAHLAIHGLQLSNGWSPIYVLTQIMVA